MDNKPASVGFIGLGTMGLAMAENLISKLPTESKMFVYDISAESIQKIKTNHPESVVSCGSAREVTEQATTVFTMVPEGSHVRTVFLDEKNGVLAATPAPRAFMDCSTIDRETSLAVSKAVKEKHPQARFFDTPVSGGEIGAKKATLTFMVGCAEDDPEFPYIQDILSLMGANIIACGGPSLGVTAKLTNNYCSAMITLATAEAMNMGMRAGMDPRLIHKIFTKSTAGSCINDKFNPVPGVVAESPASNGYHGGFKIQLMRKDVGLGVKLAESVEAKLLLAECGLKAYTAASEDPRCRDFDSRVLYRFLGGDEDWEKKKQ